MTSADETTIADDTRRGLPTGWRARQPEESDIPRLTELATAQEELVRGEAHPHPAAIRAQVVGTASWTRRQQVLERGGRVGAWIAVHDRAAGRTVVEIVIDPQIRREAAAPELARWMLRWADEESVAIARLRGIGGTQLDAGPEHTDTDLRAWLAEDGYRHTRSWEHMTRPVVHQESAPHSLPEPRAGVRVRRVRLHPCGMPRAEDLQTVHRMLEESFADHWGSYRESFPEFLQRLREDTGHAWDMWWIAEIEQDGAWLPGGAVVTSVLAPDRSGARGSYIDYIGVHRRSRGRGVAKALLHSVIREAAQRGYNRVGLEVDADSPTGADGLYRSMGWQVEHITESWHREVTVPGVDAPAPAPADV